MPSLSLEKWEHNLKKGRDGRMFWARKTYSKAATTVRKDRAEDAQNKLNSASCLTISLQVNIYFWSIMILNFSSVKRYCIFMSKLPFIGLLLDLIFVSPA